MNVRRAAEEDLPGAFGVFEATAAEGKWIASEPPLDRKDTLNRWRESSLGDSGGAMLVAEADGVIVGTASVIPEGRCGSGLFELGMCVAPDRRGKGIGGALLAACIEWVRQAGGHKITLQVWPHNDAARSLYRKFGFEEEGYLRRHWRRRSGELWDCIVMGLLLDDHS